jgi:hypothetical protein
LFLPETTQIPALSGPHLGNEVKLNSFLTIVRKELSLSYISKCEPLRAGICGVSRRNKGSAGRKIFFCDLSKISWTEQIKVSHGIMKFMKFIKFMK